MAGPGAPRETVAVWLEEDGAEPDGRLERLRAALPAAELHTALRELAASDSRPAVRVRAGELLAELAPGCAVTAPAAPVDEARLEAALVAPEAEVREDAARHLAVLPEPAARRLLDLALRRPEADPWALAALLERLGELGGADAPEEATVYLDHPSPLVAARALCALHRLEPDTARYAAMYRLESSPPEVRAAALRVLAADHRELAWGHLQAMAEDPSPWIRRVAAELAGELEPARADRFLVELMIRETDPVVLRPAIDRLRANGTSAGLGALSVLAAEGPEELRRRAGEALEAVRTRVGGEPGELARGAWDFRQQRVTLSGRGDGEATPAVMEGCQAAAGSIAGVGGPERETRPRRSRSSPTALAEATGPEHLQPTGLVAELVARLEAAPEAGGEEGRALQEAVALLRYGDAKRAVERLEACLPKRGGSVAPALRWGLAMALVADNRAARAVSWTEGLDPGLLEVDALAALAEVLEEMGAYRAAVRLHEHVLARRPDLGSVRERLAHLSSSAGDRAYLDDDSRIAISREYSRLELLGRGGMGQVFRAVNRTTGEAVALKVPDPRLLAEDVTLQRFRLEIETLAAISHPSVIRILDVSFGDVPYYAMELIEEPSLSALLRDRKRLMVEEALEILTPIAAGLAAAHHEGIVHRDLKPGNILLARDGNPRLTDFGVAYVAQRRAITSTGMVIGTLGYMAPEQIVGQALTPAADVYGFGTTFYEAVVGELPFEDNAMIKLYRDAPRAGERSRALSPALDALLGACLARDPGARPADGGELLAGLRALRS